MGSDGRMFAFFSQTAGQSGAVRMTLAWTTQWRDVRDNRDAIVERWMRDTRGDTFTRAGARTLRLMWISSAWALRTLKKQLIPLPQKSTEHRFFLLRTGTTSYIYIMAAVPLSKRL